MLGDLEDDLAALDRSDEEDYGEDLDEEYFEEEDDMDDNEEYVDLKGDDDDDVMEFVDENDLPEDDELDKDDFDDFEAEEESNIVEDIYGRKVDSKTGKIIDGIDSSKAKEKLKELENQSELTGEMRFQLTKSIRSILNRLNEGTLVQSIKTLTDLFTQNSRNGKNLTIIIDLIIVIFSDVKQILFDVFSKAILTPFALTDRLLIEYSAFISLTHQLISTEICKFLFKNIRNRRATVFYLYFVLNFSCLSAREIHSRLPKTAFGSQRGKVESFEERNHLLCSSLQLQSHQIQLFDRHNEQVKGN